MHVKLEDSFIELRPDGSIVYHGMSKAASLLSISCGLKWECFHMARRGGAFTLMLETEIRARACDERLATLLRAEGYGDDEIMPLLDRYRLDDAYQTAP